MKRSQVVSLVLLAGVGVAAVKLAERDPSQQEEDALIFTSAQACMESGLSTAIDCRAAAATAEDEAAKKAPRYLNQGQCERQHGSECRATTEPGVTVFVPPLAAFLMPPSVNQNFPVQPLYAEVGEKRSEEQHASGSAAFYRTNAGAPVQPPSNGSPRTTVPTAVAYERPIAPKRIGYSVLAPPASGDGVGSRGGVGSHAPTGSRGTFLSRGGFGSTGFGLSSGG
jgi:uncharacterized protein YgiB involved in biofilm formation